MKLQRFRSVFYKTGEVLFLTLVSLTLGCMTLFLVRVFRYFLLRNNKVSSLLVDSVMESRF